MTLIKYLGKCIFEFIDLFNPGGGNPAASWKELLVGFIASAVIVAAIVLTVIFVEANWYFGIFIALLGIIAFCLVATIIEFIIRFIVFIVKKIKASKKQ